MTLYQEIRAAGKAMQEKALKATKHLDFNPLRIAKKMTLPLNGRTLVFDGEAAQNAFFDFWFHEYRVNGKSLVESVDPVATRLTSLEAEVLAAHCRSSTSFFEMEAVLPSERQIRLRDLLNPAGPEVLLTDHGLSESADRLGARLGLFCRLLEVRGLTMTSGFAFAFQPERLPGILQAYRQKMKKVSEAEMPQARFVFFFGKYRQFGEEQEFRDVV
jgi:hypothetical protein